MKFNLLNKNALVCGSSQGIGKAIAMEFADSGANVTLLARNRHSLESVLAQLKNNGTQKHNYICSDINEHSNILLELERLKTNFHILINNTGGPSPGLLHEADAVHLQNSFKSHVISAQILTQAVINDMKTAGYGRIINIISVGLKQPIMNLGVSNTIRGAMGSWSKTLASEVAQFGITVNNILPGYTNTERLNHLFEHRSNVENKSVEDIKNDIINDVPAKRLGEPEEIGFLAAFLASEFAGYINGINVPIDGGYLRTL